MNKLVSSLTLAAVLLGAALPTLAAVELETRAFREVAATNAAGQQVTRLEPLQSAAPGQEVIYVITYRNTGDQPAQGLVVNNQVPAQMEYVGGSAEGERAQIAMSVDGSTFGPLASLRVPTADGALRPAEAADVTALRWTIEGAVAPGTSGTVRYRAVLK
ncbi:hypothetical protein Maes01_00771 [Microbulbifer aestuariivivens]|uniref:DUF11 domain-containing protein n=1 Tax=Microbulbifer aestuariivivens TaxID=1908308 RepID=A0ABP9WM13_9GAMM